MSHQEVVAAGLERLSRFVALVSTGIDSQKTLKYDIDYAGNAIPERQRFTLVADVGSLIISIKFKKGGAYILRDR